MHSRGLLQARCLTPSGRLGVAYGPVTPLRAYAGLAFNAPTSQPDASVQGVETLNRKPRIDITAGLENKASVPEESSKGEGVEVAAGLTSATKWLKVPLRDEPVFEVVSTGPGSVIVAKVPPSSHFYTTVNTAIGFSSGIETGLSTEGGPIQAVSRKLGGGALFWQRFWTTGAPGDVIIAPKQIGDIAAIPMDGTSEYYVRQKAFLAASPGLGVSSSPKGFGLGVDGIFNYRVKGKGTLAITSYGGLYRLVLAPGEEYRVDPSHIIAWDASIDPKPANQAQRAVKSTIPKFNISEKLKRLVQTPGAREAKETKKALNDAPKVAPTINSAQEIASKLLKRTADATLRVTRFTFLHIKQWLFGDRGYYLLRGPGDFYISSRLRPSLMWLKDIPAKNTVETLQIPTAAQTKPQPAAPTQ
ncbi:uncharacterized protein SPPG_04765 [Spizellomyces punctatus DAOM BR117]|uniref:Altered inheritance of mitochondria protein 24, mitochondrial n=1 Tax=Spizellomyces punctatus (strain DAOM BR117) TaxID=645134 RepID=A0A0L0HH98_SPIPD|nr:uncharacterized protein SPPG_04765 [Spizellomyces punctatus DAOM BR117]KND00447.1 hypothetical protein SPPG_04765 [Spizellomyces punctatus DAOM BR117]|eukprot:XP_016608486.1 hypothetical protein SPPG_04765 [Spizellomyces punctatus DAOM BR117]